MYLLGAGVNRGLVLPDGQRPPLAADVFQAALRHPAYADEIARPKHLADLFDYVGHYWKRSPASRRDAPFDLEACYSLLDRHVTAARSALVRVEGHAVRIPTPVAPVVWGALSALTEMLRTVLDAFAGPLGAAPTAEGRSAEAAVAADPAGWHAFRALASGILREDAAVLTFNYDTLTELALRQAARESGEPAWCPRCAYRVRFDRTAGAVPCESASGPPSTARHLDAAHAAADPASGWSTSERPASGGDHAGPCPTRPFLKVHGAINWWRVEPTPPPSGLEYLGEMSPCDLPPDRRPFSLYSPTPPAAWVGDRLPRGWRARPLLITPVVNKRTDREPFGALWEAARDLLGECERLVVIGYSFPPTDFHVRQLFLEAFVDARLRELTVVNPDTSVVQVARDLTHFRGPVRVSRDVTDFAATPAGSLRLRDRS